MPPSIQLENGFTQIANELLEAIYRTRLSGLQKDVFMCVLRFTYGYNKKQAELSVRFIAEQINTKHNRVAEALNKLIDLKMLIVVEDYSKNHSGRILSINKNYDQWKQSENEGQSDFEGEKSPNMGGSYGPILRNNINTSKYNYKDSAKSHKNHLVEEFEKFWNFYDKKTDKKKCWIKWKRLSKADKSKIRVHIPEYIRSTPDTQFRKNPLTYLNGECWNDEIISTQNGNENLDSQISLVDQVGVQ